MGSMDMQAALPTLNNNIENYLSWKIKRDASMNKYFGEKKQSKDNFNDKPGN